MITNTYEPLQIVAYWPAPFTAKKVKSGPIYKSCCPQKNTNTQQDMNKNHDNTLVYTFMAQWRIWHIIFYTEKISDLKYTNINPLLFVPNCSSNVKKSQTLSIVERLATFLFYGLDLSIFFLLTLQALFKSIIRALSYYL